jgi:tRNA(Ile)-lysidine synthetase-like protein
LVLLGQHAQDQAETMLLNLVRGAGPRGAAGMLALSPLQGAPRIRLGRPFLALTPQTLRVWLKRKRQPWREDASNRDTRLVRNRLRHGVLPQLITVNPKAVEHLAAFAASLAPAKKTRDLAGLLQLDRAARARAAQVLAQGKGQADLGRGWTLQLGQGRGRLLQAPAPLRLRVGLWQAWGPEWRFRLKLAAVTARNLKQDKAFWFPAPFAKKALRVRAAAAGDRIQAFGLSAGSKLLMDCLAEAKVPVWQRRDWPVLVLGAQVLALPPWRRSRLAPVQAGAKALCLQWSRVPALSGQA